MSKKVKIRQARSGDIDGILRVEKEAWGESQAANRKMFESRLKVFPEGTLVAELDDKIIGVVVTEIVSYDIEKQSFTWYEVTDNGYLKNSHNKDGDSLFGVDLSVLPDAPRGTGSKLLGGVGKLAIRYNLKRGILGGRIPEYCKYKDKYTPEEYLKQTIIKDGKKVPLDPEIRFYKKADLKIIKVIPNYYKDPESLDYGVLLVWNNPFYNKWYRNLAAKIFKV